ncbi:MAG: radical SAM protein [Mycoplasmataceae bacterium]|jgi:23S rRNA (adenine2503-C2)-methyltransferase|nr:radical SAM protein [Mycoplasmataceae bacterium]
MAAIQFEFGFSGCCSTQVGCNMGCKFCASGLTKKIRNLNANEIIGEILYTQSYLVANGLTPLQSLSFMGIGEPFDNLDNVMHTIKYLHSEQTMNMGMRKFTLSTCGIVNKLPIVAKELPQVNVAISLHAPNDTIRNQIMPINQAFNVAEVIKYAKNYVREVNHDITFQYVLINGVNDSDECAIQLANLIRDIDCHVTLIEYNEVDEFKFKHSNNSASFKKILTNNHISFSERLKRGDEIKASCGSMRINHLKNDK